MKKLSLILLLALAPAAALADTVELWSGSQDADWNRGLSVSTMPAYKKSGPGDVIHIYYDVKGTSPGIKLAIYTPWQEICSAYNLKGTSYEYTLTEELFPQLFPGTLTIQGQDVTFRRVTITTDHPAQTGSVEIADPDPRPDCVFGDYETAYLYGSSLKKKGITAFIFEPKGALGWYWDGGIDLSGAAKISLELGKPNTSILNMAVIWGDDPMEVYVAKIPRNSNSYTLDLTSAEATEGHDYAHVTAISLLNAGTKKMDVDITNFKILDASGNEYEPGASGVREIDVDDTMPVRVEYYNLQGMRMYVPEGMTIVRSYMPDGRVVTTKKLFKQGL